MAFGGIILAAAAADMTLRVGSMVYDYVQLGDRLETSLQQQALRDKAQADEAAEVGERNRLMAQERVGRLQRDIGSINATFAAAGLAGGASQATLAASTGAFAAEQGAQQATQAARVLRNINIQRRESKLAFEADRRQQRQDVLARGIGQVQPLAQSAQNFAEGLKEPKKDA